MDGYRGSLFLLLGAIGLVLLIACGNVASLLVARGRTRSTEMAVRTAVGSGRGRLIRQLLTESVLLALATARTEPARDLREGGRGTALGNSRFRSSLVVFQVAVSVILLVGSALLARSLGNIMAVEPGFDPEVILAAEVSLPPAEYQDGEERLRFFTEFQESILNLPGVEAVGLIDRLPIRNGGNNVGIWSTDRPPATNSSPHYAYQHIVTPGYFQTMKVPLLAGREFNEDDGPETPLVIMLSQMSAETVFPGENPLGRQVAVDLGSDEPALFEVVGVVADQRLSSLRSRSRLAMYFPCDQRRAYTMELAVRTSGEPSSLIRPIQERLWAMNRDIPLATPEALTQSLADSVSGSRAMATMLGLFSVVALFLAALGLYGVLAHFVARSGHEIGIRMAMGASRSRVARMILSRGLLLVGVGLILGFSGAFGATRYLEEFLFETGTLDLPTYAGVGGFFAAVSLVACLIPAWRALRLDPADAFRAE